MNDHELASTDSARIRAKPTVQACDKVYEG